MLANAGAERPRAEAVDLSALVDDMARLVDPPGGAADVYVDLVKGLPSGEGDTAQIGQVVTNLVTNAFESLAPGPASVAIRTGEMEIREQLPVGAAVPFEPPAPGRYVYFEVEDTGCGMDEDTRARIFDPFFTTKFTGRGLGLAAVLGIVRAHEGCVEIESEVERGTRFRVLFPVAGIV
jgi:signal transduction histidine kinase